MKVICINNELTDRIPSLTINKIYDVENDDDLFYKGADRYIVNSDTGLIRTYYKSRFISLNIVRKQKLSKII